MASQAFRPLVKAAAQGQLGEGGRRMLRDVEFARTAFARAYEYADNIRAETFKIYLAPLYATPESTWNLERFVAGQDCRQPRLI